ncbi:MAG: hypothetical protein LBP52_06495 [Burkholderiaceae bacterium]|jgi:hypothetical protein|nr:hypothetical protein [Burkholderiaceae bacterium]
MLVYAIVKFIVYCLWCFIGLRLLAPAHARPVAAIGYGALRWLLGLGLGIGVFILAGSIKQESAGLLYLLIYTPLRVVEWGIIAAILLGRYKVGKSGGIYARVISWVAGGILVSYLSDMVSPEGLAGKFCVGRCLC